MEPTAARLQDAAAQRSFITAGHAVFTILNTKTGNRYTFRAKSAGGRRPRSLVNHRLVVEFLAGPDNQHDYEYLGLLIMDSSAANGYVWRDARRGAPTKILTVFRWFLERLFTDTLPECVEIWHAGRCGRCSRPLTDPESIARGLGPVCVGA